MNTFDQFVSSYGDPVSFKAIMLSLLMAFGLTQAIAAVYVWTFRGRSYSRSFVQAVALGSIVACMLMLAINNSVAAGLGIAGSLAIIRFRTSMRDPRDMVFIFASMGAGITAGLRAHLAAILGTVVFCIAAILLTGTEFGSKRQFDGLLRIQLPVKLTDIEIAKVLRQHTKKFVLVTLREVSQGDAMEHAYQVRFATDKNKLALVKALEEIPGSSDVSLMLQEPTVEI